jgi:hypothetical protein
MCPGISEAPGHASADTVLSATMPRHPMCASVMVAHLSRRGDVARVAAAYAPLQVVEHATQPCKRGLTPRISTECLSWFAARWAKSSASGRASGVKSGGTTAMLRRGIVNATHTGTMRVPNARDVLDLQHRWWSEADGHPWDKHPGFRRRQALLVRFEYTGGGLKVIRLAVLSLIKGSTFHFAIPSSPGHARVCVTVSRRRPCELTTHATRIEDYNEYLMLDDPESDAQAAPFASPSQHTNYTHVFEDPRYLSPHDASTISGARQDEQSHHFDPRCVDSRDYREEFPDNASALNSTIESLSRTHGFPSVELLPQPSQLPQAAESVVGGVYNLASTPDMINGMVCLLSV